MVKSNCCNKNDREPIAMCFAPADGSPSVGIVAIPAFDGDSNIINTIYMGPIGPNGEVGPITLDAFLGGGSATLGACPLPSGALLVEGCMADPVTGEPIEGVVGVNQADGSLMWGPISKDDYGFVDCCPSAETTDPVGVRYQLSDDMQAENTKYNLDDPGASNAYGDVGNANWTASQLAASLNANAANATGPTVPSNIDYSTTVWAGDDAGNYVYVVSGPVPATLDLVSVPVSIPVT